MAVSSYGLLFQFLEIHFADVDIDAIVQEWSFLTIEIRRSGTHLC